MRLLGRHEEAPTISQVRLQRITPENWWVCCSLRVSIWQRSYVAKNTWSLAQAAYSGEDWRPYGIYNGDTMVGFIMFGIKDYKGRAVWSIERVMVDRNHQGNGYGGKAVRMALDMMRADPMPITEVQLSYIPANKGAAYLYKKLGFTHVGKAPDNYEELMVLSLI